MFGLGMPEILLILAIALIVIGPKKLPDLAKTLGRAMGEFKRSAQDFKRSIDVETTVKDIKDVVDPKVDLEGIIKETNTKDEPSTDSDPDIDPEASADEEPEKDIPDTAHEEIKSGPETEDQPDISEAADAENQPDNTKND